MPEISVSGFSGALLGRILAIGGGVGLFVLALRRLERLERKLDGILKSERERVGSEDRIRSKSSLTDRRGTRSNASRVVTAVLTGGPCGGKSTGLAQAAERLQELGVRVYVVPEAATMMFAAGCPFPVSSPASVQLAWEGAKMRIQEGIEGEFREVALAEGSPSLILCDRGMVDSKAYVGSEEDWETLLEDNGWSEEKLLNRYDIVVHLTTAAYGAEAFFTDANNQARREDTALARQVDDRVRAAWKDHPCGTVVDNSTNFSEKIDRVFSFLGREVMRRTGKDVASDVIALKAASSDVVYQTYLITAGSVHDVWTQLASEVPSQLTYTFLSGDVDRILRRRTRGHTTSHILSTRDAQGVTRTARIARHVYKELLLEADPQLSSVEMIRHTIVEEGGNLCTLDIVKAPQRLQLLSVPKLLPKPIFEAWTAALSLTDVSQDANYTRRGIAAMSRLPQTPSNRSLR